MYPTGQRNVEKWKCKVNTCTGTGLSERQEASGRRGLARGRTDHRPTTTQHRQRRPTVHQVKATGTWQRLDGRRQKNGVSNPSRYADSVPKQTSRRRYSNGPCRITKPRQRRGHPRTTIRQGRLSDNSVRQLRPTLDNSRLCGDTHGRRYVPSDNSQLRGGTHGQRYVQRVCISTPSNNFRGYFHSPLTSLDSATFIHWSRLYLTSVTFINRSHKIIFRRTLTSPLSHVQLLSTATLSQLLPVSTCIDARAHFSHVTPSWLKTRPHLR